jgi:hypothetical protein
MQSGPIQVLQAGQRQNTSRHRPRVVIAGATGVMGHEVLRRLAGPFGAM